MNDISVKAADIAEASRMAGMLASVQIGVWEGMKLDKRSLEEYKKLHGAHGNIGRMNINLLAGHDGPLKDVHSAYFAVRTRHYELTLPWVNDPHAVRQRGPRWLSHLLLQQYVLELSALKKTAIELLEGTFLPAYDGLVVNAQGNLGTISAHLTYPSQAEIKKLFRVHFDFEPIPDRAGFTGLDPHVITQLGNVLDKKRKMQQDVLMHALWDEVRGRVTALIEATKKPSSATVGNVRELLTLLPGWNMTGSKVVDDIRNDIDELLSGIEAEDLRKDEKLRTNTAAEAQKIVDKMTKLGL